MCGTIGNIFVAFLQNYHVLWVKVLKIVSNIITVWLSVFVCVFFSQKTGLILQFQKKKTKKKCMTMHKVPLKDINMSYTVPESENVFHAALAALQNINANKTESMEEEKREEYTKENKNETKQRLENTVGISEDAEDHNVGMFYDNEFFNKKKKEEEMEIQQQQQQQQQQARQQGHKQQESHRSSLSSNHNPNKPGKPFKVAGLEARRASLIAKGEKVPNNVNVGVSHRRGHSRGQASIDLSLNKKITLNVNADNNNSAPNSLRPSMDAGGTLSKASTVFEIPSNDPKNAELQQMVGGMIAKNIKKNKLNKEKIQQLKDNSIKIQIIAKNFSGSVESRTMTYALDHRTVLFFSFFFLLFSFSVCFCVFLCVSVCVFLCDMSNCACIPTKT